MNIISSYKGKNTFDSGIFYSPCIPLTGGSFSGNFFPVLKPKIKIRNNVIVFYNVTDELIYSLFDESENITIINIKHSKYKNNCIILHTTEESLFYLKLKGII